MLSAVIHAIHSKYISKILESGVLRKSSAVFTLHLPYNQDEDLLYSTLRVGSFHGIGLSVFEKAIDKQITISEALGMEGSSTISFVTYLTDIDFPASSARRYIVDNKVTYSYYRVCDVGSIIKYGSIIQNISLDSALLNVYIDNSKNDNMRFFHKEDKLCYQLKHGGGESIDLLCKKMASSIVPQLISILKEY